MPLSCSVGASKAYGSIVKFRGIDCTQAARASRCKLPVPTCYLRRTGSRTIPSPALAKPANAMKKLQRRSGIAPNCPPLGSHAFLARRVVQTLPFLICLILVILLPALTASAARADADHIQQSTELMNAGDLQAAEEEARLALPDSANRPLAWATLGIIRFRQKRYAEAGDFLTKALQLRPDLVGARVMLGEVYARTGKEMRAREAFAGVLRDNPDNLEAHLALADLESKAGNFSASLRAAEPVLAEIRRSPDGILLLAKDYSGLKQKDQLPPLVHDWQLLPEPSAQSTAEFASLLVKSGLDQDALTILEKAKSSGQVSYELAAALANLYFTNGDLSRAFGSYEAALSLNPGCAGCLLQLANIAMQQKDSEKALAYLIRAKRQQPDNAEILFAFGKTCLELDLLDDAISALQKASRLHPNNDSYTYVLASAYVSKKQYAVAGRLFQALLTKHPNDSVLNYAMGSLLFLEVKLGEAAKYLRRSVELKPDQIAAYYYLGLVAEAKGENGQAIATLGDVLRRDSGYSPAYEALGGIFLKERKYPEAEQALEKAVLLNPNSVKAHYQLGILLGRTGRKDDANKELAIVQQLNAAEEKRAGMRLRILTPH